MPPPAYLDDLVAIAGLGGLAEHRITNVELKSSWASDDGRKLSALAIRIDALPKWLVVGIDDNGVLLGRSEAWARQVEQVLSEHINDNLNPAQACSAVACQEVGDSWIVVVRVQNPGDVVYWGDRAFQAAGTTITELAPDEVLTLRLQALVDLFQEDQDDTEPV